MNIQIHNDQVAGIATPLAAPVESAAQRSGSTQTESTGHSGADQVAISSLSGNIAASAAALANQQAARVSQLAAIYAKGEYQPDSLATSRALVSAAIAGGSVEEDS
jgi:hypothetical protein